MRTSAIMLFAPGWLLASAALAGPPAPVPVTAVVVQTPVPLTHDACLDHTVKELGMSATRAAGPARHWDIAPKFLHGALAKDTAAKLTVDLEKSDTATTVAVRTSFAGAPKEKATQAELEERLRLMATKMAQQCGVIKPELACTLTPAGGVAAPCAPPPAAPAP